MVFGLLLASTQWTLLLAVAVFLVVAWVTARPDNSVLATGLVFCAVLGGGALLFGLGGGLGLDETLRRASRAALLVLAATWLRAAAGAAGLREVGRRMLAKARRMPSMPEAAAVLDSLGSERRLVAGARALAVSLRDVPYRPVPFLDAVLGWVVGESRRPEPDSARPALIRLARVAAPAHVGAGGGPAAALGWASRWPPPAAPPR